VNEALGAAVQAVGAILDAESRRVGRQRDLTGLIETLRRGVAEAAARGDAV